MSDLMLYGVLRMPYDMAMSSELSRRQFYDRVQEAAARLQRAEAASPAAAVPEGALPPPDAISSATSENWWAEKTIRAYGDARARAAVEADRAQRLENANCRWPLCESEARQEEIGLQAYRELYSGESASDKSLNAKENTARSHASSASIKSDRAQQGETVACPCPNLEIEHDNDTGGAFCKGNCPSAATKAAAPDAPTDELINLIVAYGAACTCMNVTASRDLMAEIKGKLSGAAPVPDTGIPTAGEVPDFAKAIHWPECWDTAAYPTAVSALVEVYAYFKCTECSDAATPDADCHESCGHIGAECDFPACKSGRAPVSSTPTAGAVENQQDAARYRWIEENARVNGGGHGFTITAYVPFDEEDMGCGIDRAIAAAPQPPEAKAGEPCAHCNRLPGERRDECEHCPAKAKAGEPVPWQVLEMKDQPEPGRLLDVVLTNGVIEEGREHSAIDWTQVADWRYSRAKAGEDA